MNNLFDPWLASTGIIILDGALATELENRGANLNDPLWSARLLIENPALIRQVHLDYLRAGAQVITSASYQASFAGFARAGYTQEQAAGLLRLSVQLAIEARAEWAADSGAKTSTHSAKTATRNDPASTPNDPTATRNAKTSADAAIPGAASSGSPRPLVAASIGPYGAFLADGSEYRGHYGLSIEALMDFHRPRIAVLADSGADLLACETIPCLEEGQALIRLLKEFPDLQAWLSFSCKDGEHVCDGGLFSDCAALGNASDQVLAVGANCTPPEFIDSLIKVARSVTDKPIVVYPNQGETYDAVHKCWLPGETAPDFANQALGWYKAGARLIGGCCRTTPDDIRAFKQLLTR